MAGAAMAAQTPGKARRPGDGGRVRRALLGILRARTGEVAGDERSGGAAGAAVALAVCRSDDPSQAAGSVEWAALSGGVPWTGEEPEFLLYSITKIVIACLVCRLAEEGRLGLGESLARWFPDLPGASRIELRQVLGHTAGLPDYGPLPEYHEAVRRRPGRPWSFGEFVQRTVAHGPDFEPGRGFAYSNPGYMLLRAVVERESGLAFGDAVTRFVSGPLGLASFRVPAGIGDLEGLAPARSAAVVDGGPPADVRRVYHPGWVSHGTLVGTASDTVRLLDALARGRVTSAASLREMTALTPVPRSHVPRGGIPWATASYGLGLMGDPDGPLGPIWGHNGSGPGYTGSAFHSVRSGVSACALCAREEPLLTERLVVDALSGGTALGSGPMDGSGPA